MIFIRYICIKQPYSSSFARIPILTSSLKYSCARSLAILFSDWNVVGIPDSNASRVVRRSGCLEINERMSLDALPSCRPCLVLLCQTTLGVWLTIRPFRTSSTKYIQFATSWYDILSDNLEWKMPKKNRFNFFHRCARNIENSRKTPQFYTISLVTLHTVWT